MPYKNIELRRQRGRERYQRQREERLKYAHEYYVKNSDTLREKNRVRAHESREKYKTRIQAYLEKTKEKRSARSREYYHKHKERLSARVKEYHIEHHDEIMAKKAQAKTELNNARQMCPAFKFVDKIRLADPALYTTKYRIGSNLAHKAAKKCAAIVNGDYTLCPICSDCTMSENQMKCACPMPKVFEFDGAVTAIRTHAVDIVMANQK